MLVGYTKWVTGKGRGRERGGQGKCCNSPPSAESLKRGQREPIIIHSGKLLDGQNRHRACVDLKFAPQFREHTDGDPLAYVVSLNLKRRHLSETQRAMIVAEITTIYTGRPPKDEINSSFRTQSIAAQMMSVHPKMVQSAIAIKNRGIPELNKAVRIEEIPLTPAARIARLPEYEQPAAIKETRAKPKRRPLAERGMARLKSDTYYLKLT